MKPLYLVGFMGVGKSTVGKRLASLMGLEFLDLDVMFECKYKLSIQAFFQKYGETLFRQFEQEVLKSTFGMTNVVVSTGGGTPCYGSSMDDMCRHGLTIYLHMPPAALVSRLVGAKRQRPLLEGKTEDELSEYVSCKLNERLPYYTRAHLHVDALSLDVGSLVEKIRGYPDVQKRTNQGE